MFRFASHLFRVTGALAVLAWVNGAAGQQGPWYEGFEGAAPTWKFVGGSAPYRLELHQRSRGEAHTGEGCEHLRITAGQGSEVFVAHPADRPRVIDELLMTVWVKADRPGVQLAAQVVLPRTRDPRSGRPVTTVLYGSSYTLPGQWQQLRVDNLPRLLTRQTWILRTQLGPTVDPREAYVEQVLLNVYGGPGATEVWIDDLDIAGHAAMPHEQSERPAAAVPLPPAGSRAEGTATVTDQPAERGRVRLEGSILLVDGRPFFVRMIQYQGEPLDFLRQLGFNAVWLSRWPTVEMLEEARRLGLWLVCPPLQPLPQAGTAPLPPEIPPGYDGVLAWDLGAGLGAQQSEAVSQWAEQIRAAEPRHQSRPLVCRPSSHLHSYSRATDLVILGRSPLGTSLELNDYGAWLRQQPRFLRHGTPFWTTIPTQPPEPLRAQWAALIAGAAGTGSLGEGAFSAEQIRLLVYTAITAGSRGLMFESFSPLNATDPDTRTRAGTLALLNLELDLVEPWAVAGSVVATVNGSEPGTVATAIQCEHGRLLVPIWSPPRAQLVPGQAAGNRVTFVVPGIPETNSPYLLMPGRLARLVRERPAGGLQVTLDEFDLTSLVLLTGKPQVVSAMTQRTLQNGRRAAELQRELAAAKFQTVSQISSRLSGAAPPRSREWLDTARKDLGRCDAMLAARDDASAYLLAQRAMRPLRLLERAWWESVAASLRSPVSSPPAVSFATLPWHAVLVQRVAASQPLANLLPGGDFEDLGQVFGAGWQHIQHPAPSVVAGAELSPEGPHTGRSCLRLTAQPSRPETAPLMVESPPVWITSPPVPVVAGQLLRIQGWVRLSQPISGSVDGLLILDSLGGEPLAERIRRTDGWEQFTLYRIAPASGTLTLTFALSGFGEARIDDVTIHPLQSGGQPMSESPSPSSAGSR